MAYFRQVRIVRAHSAQTFQFDVNSHELNEQYEKFVRRAIKMPKTVRVEVTETDTQLYAYPLPERTYMHKVFVNGKCWNFYGKSAEAAYLQ